jgi:predicted SnoaL-like aldol condensation-catalyzing enzyme
MKIFRKLTAFTALLLLLGCQKASDTGAIGQEDRAPEAALSAASAAYAAVVGHPDPLLLLESDDPQLAFNKRLVFDFWRSVVNGGQVELADELLAEGYIQHSPVLPTGRTAFKEIFSVVPRLDPVPALVSPPLVAMVAEGDLVVMAMVETLPEPDGSGSYTTTHFNLFRIEAGRLAEHWHSVQTAPGPEVSLPEAGGPQPVSGLAGLAQYALLEASDPGLARNKRLVFDVWRQIVDAGHEELADLYLAEDYIQHNPNAATGRDGFKAFFATLEDLPIETWIRDPLVAMVAEGDLVVQAIKWEFPHPVHAGRTYTTTWFDMFRIADGRLAEHWDAAARGDMIAPEVLSQVDDCPAEEGIRYICGILNAEDILRIGDTDWVLVSGMAVDMPGNPGTNGRLHLVNSQDESWELVFPGASPSTNHDTAMYPQCPGPLDTSNFSAHGIALQNFPAGSNQYRLYMTSHGAREAIEVFQLDVSAQPTITWTGCVPLPETVWANSVVILQDGGFMATKFMDPNGSGFEAIRAEEINGHVVEWRPGSEVTAIPGTELSGPNGIAITDDERYLYVAVFGGTTLARFDLSTRPVSKVEIELGVVPDNVRWSSVDTLYTAGGNIEGACLDAAGNPCGAGWSVWEIDPDMQQARRVTGMRAGSAMPFVSSALLIGDEVWVGTPFGDKVGILPMP